MESDNHVPKQFKPYLWKKGVSGNPKGRPKGKTLKEFAKEYLMTLPDEEKIDFLASLPTEIVWKMAEGNPTNEITGKDGKDLIPDVIAKEKIDKAISSYINGNTKDSR